MTDFNITEIIKSAKYAYEIKNYISCLNELEKLEKYNTIDNILELKVECYLHLKHFSKIIDLKGPFSDNILYYKTIAYFELQNFDEAVKCINSALTRLNPDRFIELFHSYLNPFENFNLFWKYLDKESKHMLGTQMDYGTINNDLQNLKKGQIIKSYKLDDACLKDFIKLIKTESIDLSCLSGDGSYGSPYASNGAKKLNNLGFLKYFENLKIIGLGRIVTKSF